MERTNKKCGSSPLIPQAHQQGPFPFSGFGFVTLQVITANVIMLPSTGDSELALNLWA